MNHGQSSRNTRNCVWLEGWAALCSKYLCTAANMKLVSFVSGFFVCSCQWSAKKKDCNSNSYSPLEWRRHKETQRCLFLHCRRREVFAWQVLHGSLWHCWLLTDEITATAVYNLNSVFISLFICFFSSLYFPCKSPTLHIYERKGAISSVCTILLIWKMQSSVHTLSTSVLFF